MKLRLSPVLKFGACVALLAGCALDNGSASKGPETTSPNLVDATIFCRANDAAYDVSDVFVTLTNRSQQFVAVELLVEYYEPSGAPGSYKIDTQLNPQETALYKDSVREYFGDWKNLDVYACQVAVLNESVIAGITERREPTPAGSSTAITAPSRLPGSVVDGESSVDVGFYRLDGTEVSITKSPLQAQPCIADEASGTFPYLRIWWRQRLPDGTLQTWSNWFTVFGGELEGFTDDVADWFSYFPRTLRYSNGTCSS